MTGPVADGARLTAHVTGRVQGVGFRWWAQARARQLGLHGYAGNLPDGRVQVVAEGERGACEALLDALRGPRAPGAVSRVDASWGSATGELAGFHTR